MFLVGIAIGLLILVSTMDQDELDKLMQFREVTERKPWRVYMPDKKEDKKE